MPSITLEDFNEAVDVRFEDTAFTVAPDKVARFKHPLRLTQAKRESINTIANRFVANDFESEKELRDACIKLFEDAAKTKADHTAMKKFIGEDTSRAVVAAELLIEAWGGLAGVGEA